MASSAASHFPKGREAVDGFRAAGVQVLHVSGSALGDARMRADIAEICESLHEAGIVLSIDPNIRTELMSDAGYLATVRRLFACDAVALLRLENDCLLPLAIDGLSPDTLGRRFRVAEHPRLQRLLEARQATRFPPDSSLPDPYDGLVEASQGQLEVHDCMGVVLQMEGEPWGLLTLDALTPGRFTPAQVESLGAFGNFAAATVAAATRIGCPST